MDFGAALQQFSALHAQFDHALDSGLLVFSRLLGFINFAPIFNRKDIPFMVKVAMALYFTAILMWVIPLGGTVTEETPGHFILEVMMNAIIGSLLGFIADMILQAVYAAGDLMNNQIGLSSAMMFDPSARKQVALMGTLYIYITTLVFINVGGTEWLILALQRSFDKFPLHVINPKLTQVLDIHYVILVSGNVLKVATELIAPIMVVTLAVDVILGIINRTAQQMPVFQLSAALKPAIGIAIMFSTLPIFIHTLCDYLRDYSRFF